jgi:adenine-specific DNA-methyltransferase
MPITKLRPSYAFTQERLEQLKQVVPEAFAEGKVNWDVLREAMGEHLEDEGPAAEHFGLFWPGKREARGMAAMPSKGTLVPVPGEGVAEGNTRNVFIEGENLEVLKILQKSYAGCVKLIYIDPPYNTGNDFIYEDDFKEPLEEYLRKTGEATETGELLTTNTRASGRFHSTWLDMMYPRMLLSRTLLRDDGVVFVSIDDNEAHNLWMVMNEIFGEENFVDCIVWQKKVSPSNDAKWFSSDHDYLLVYAKSKEIWRPKRLPFNERQRGYYKNPDNDPRGPWNSATYTCNKSKVERPNLYYAITNPNTGEEVWPKETAVWAYSRELHGLHVEQNLLYWGVEGRSKMPRLKKLLPGEGEVVPRSIWPYSEVGHTQEATKEFLEFFPRGGFVSPKPTRLIRRILELSTNLQGGDIVLDFFAGTCTTAQAVLELNEEDGGDRRFVVVQLPEPTTDPEYTTIAEIGRARIRFAVNRLQDKEGTSKKDGRDTGFKCYQLARSSYQVWQDPQADDIEELGTLFERAGTSLVDGWIPNHLLAEVTLLQGFPLDSRLTPLTQLAENEIVLVESEMCAHRLFVCLDERLTGHTIANLKLGSDDLFACMDSALTDQDKARLADACNLLVI